MGEIARRVFTLVEEVGVANIIVHFKPRILERDRIERKVYVAVRFNVQHWVRTEHVHHWCHKVSQLVEAHALPVVSRACSVVTPEHISVGRSKDDRWKPLWTPVFKHVRVMDGNYFRGIVDLDDLIWQSKRSGRCPLAIVLDAWQVGKEEGCRGRRK